MDRTFINRVAVALAVAVILAAGGWIFTLHEWRIHTELRLSRVINRNSDLWQLAISAHNERNLLRIELGLPPEPWKQHFDGRAGASVR